MPTENSSRVPYQRYPWDDYMDGKWRVFTKGDDFICSVASFRVAAHKAASARGWIARTVRIQDSDPEQIKIGFFPKKEPQ